MALTKAATVLRNDVSLTAGAASTTSADQDLTGAYRATLRVRFTNGATGPTVAAQVKVQLSEDTTAGNYMTMTTVDGGTVNGAVTEYVLEIPDTTTHLRIIDGSNTGQAVTLRVVLEKITAL